MIFLNFNFLLFCIKGGIIFIQIAYEEVYLEKYKNYLNIFMKENKPFTHLDICKMFNMI